jgi:hypothetical protein
MPSNGGDDSIIMGMDGQERLKPPVCVTCFVFHGVVLTVSSCCYVVIAAVNGIVVMESSLTDC